MRETTDPSILDIAPEVKTLLATDMVASTKLIEKLGDEEAAQIFARHDRLIRDLAVKNKGQEIDKTDGFLFLFARPTDAVKFSLLYHDALGELSEKSGQEMTTRIGIHLGEVILRRNKAADVERGAKPLEVEGLAKHLVARVMSLAGGKQTLLTAPPFQLARRNQTTQSLYPEDTAWVKHGHYSLKGIDEPIMIYEVGRRGRAPLSAPADTEKVKRIQGRVTSGYDEATLELPEPKQRTPWAIPVVLFAVLALAIGYFQFMRPPTQPSGPGNTTANTAAPAKQSAKEKTSTPKSSASKTVPFILHLISRPPGALFEVEDGAVLGTAPTTLELPAHETQFRLKASLAGYVDAKVYCVVTAADIQRRSGLCTAELQKINSRTPPAKKPPRRKNELEGYKENPFGDD